MQSQSEFATSYVAVIGPQTAWPGAHGVSFREIKDGHHNTILLVEVANSEINWMEPRDVSIEQIVDKKDAGEDSGLRIVSHGGIRCVLGCGSLRVLRPDCSPQELMGALAIADGEILDEDAVMLPEGD